ncbi:MAG: GNAT family N-acetyltransferase [Patescibacteria group bacterium]|jgi:ribosomal protein S18 acetylase RimI-like enzyme
MINIRKATIKDLEGILELGKLLAVHERKCDLLLTPFDIKKSKAKYKRRFADSKACLFVAEKDGDIIGFVYGLLKKSPSHIKGHKKIGRLQACYVKKEFRRKQVATKLTDELLYWFGKQNVTLIDLNVYANNEAINAWRKIGFKDYDVQMRLFLKRKRNDGL